MEITLSKTIARRVAMANPCRENPMEGEGIVLIDELDLPITALKTVDAGTVGSAMLTGIATGFFENLEDAADHMVEQTVTYYPREAMHEKYMQIYERYEKVYEAVRPLV